MSRRLLISLLNALFAALFAVGAAIQLNDPDPLRWICIYLLACAACLLRGRLPRDWIWPALVAAFALGWALWIAVAMSDWVRPAAMFEPMESYGGAVEESRELFGLGIIAFWMIVLAISSRRLSRRA